MLKLSKLLFEKNLIHEGEDEGDIFGGADEGGDEAAEDETPA